MNVLIIDNYDSFTFNLYQYIGEILQTMDSDKDGAKEAANVIVKRNNEITLADVQAMNLDRIIISPGPGAPDDPAYFGGYINVNFTVLIDALALNKADIVQLCRHSFSASWLPEAEKQRRYTEIEAIAAQFE